LEKAVTDRPCDCGRPDRSAKNPALPVVFDEEMNEYHIAYGPERRGHLIIRYCPWCGGKLPESRRGSFFTEPDPAEVSEVKHLMSDVRDIPTMLRVLGEPDETYEWSPADDEAVRFCSDESARCKRQFTYRSKWRTLVLFVDEGEDGCVKAWAMSGQPKCSA
jgi:hypothetical protein